MKKFFLSISVIIGLGACSSWPPPGHSGAAEQLPYDNDKIVDRTRLTKTQHELVILREMGAVDYLPAAFEIAAVQWDRAARTVQGGFPKAASADLDRLEAMLSEMRDSLRNKLSITTGKVSPQQSMILP